MGIHRAAQLGRVRIRLALDACTGLGCKRIRRTIIIHALLLARRGRRARGPLDSLGLASSATSQRRENLATGANQAARQTTYLINLRRLLVLTLLLVNRLRGRLLRLLGLGRRRRLALRLLLFLLCLLRVMHGALVVVVVFRLLLRAVLDQEVGPRDRHGDCAEEPLIAS